MFVPRFACRFPHRLIQTNCDKVAIAQAMQVSSLWCQNASSRRRDSSCAQGGLSTAKSTPLLKLKKLIAEHLIASHH